MRTLTDKEIGRIVNGPEIGYYKADRERLEKKIDELLKELMEVAKEMAAA